MTNDILLKNSIKDHLSLNSCKNEAGIVSESSLVHALRNIRLITGRNEETGLASSDGYLGNWIGAMGYLSVLDQIGKCYRPITKNKLIHTRKPSINKALDYFTTLSDDEINAIYALRNAFLHDFSLLNKDNTKNFHHFAVNADNSTSVVILPSTKWDGNINSRNAANRTIINLQALGDLVENIYEQLLRLDSSNQLSLDLNGGEAELKARYIFYH
jgi:hypothetical protein